jgi:PAS domain S-box-containing protein
MEPQSSEALQQENERLREQIAALTARLEHYERGATPAASADSTPRSSQEAFQADELELFRTILESSPDNILIWDEHYNYLYANQAAIDQVGTTRDKVIGKNIRDGLGHIPDFMHIWMSRIDHVIATGETVHREENMQIGDIIATGIYTMFPVRDKAGRVYAMGLIYRDITERKQQEEILHQQAQILEQVRGSIVVVDMQGTIMSWNRDSVRLFGYTPEEIIGKPIVTLYPPEEHERLLSEVILPLQEQGELETETLVCTKTGTRIPILLSLSLLHDDSGTPVGMIGFSTDISEQKQMEAERAALQQQIIDVQRDALRELSTPLIPITDDVLIMPLIGTIDSGRAQMVMEALLEGVAQHQADLVILDITGVSVVDTQVAQAFIQAAQAVRLLGAQVMLTGIGPHVAQTLVTLGVDLSDIITRGNLQAGIAAALSERFHT